MHTLEQQLDVWRATVAYVQQHGALPAIERIIPALVSLWNASKGGCDVSSAYLKLLNNPSIKHMEIENILWDVTVRLGLLQAYHVWRWSAAGLRRINEATSFAQLTRIGVRNEKTFKGFLSLAMKFFITHAIHPEPQQQQARPRPLCEPDVVMRQFVAYFNNEEGRGRRGSLDVHYFASPAASTSTKCNLCHNTRQDKCQRTSFQCVTCLAPMKITLCRVGRHHELAQGKFTSCWDLFHSPTFTVPSKTEAKNKSFEFIPPAGADVGEDGEGVII